MRRTYLGVPFSAFLAATFVALSAYADDGTLQLDNGWRMQSAAHVATAGDALSAPNAGTDGWYDVKVPTTVLAALVDNKVYPDPYYGLNLKSIPGYQQGRWIIQKADSPFRDAWWFRTQFTAPAAFKDKHLTLHFDGINYRANIWLNGKQLATTDKVIGMFRRFEFDVTDVIATDGPNVLAVQIFAPGLLPEKNYRTKQVEATTGWDDHNPLPPDGNMGIWRPVYITASGAVRVKNPYVETHLDLPSLESAHLTVSAELQNTSDKDVTAELSGTIESIAFTQSVPLKAGESRVIIFTPGAFPQLNIAKPRIWWPVNLGSQEMYTLALSAAAGGVASDSVTTTFGIREATTYINDEGWRAYKVNGRNVLIRGGAWMTSDMMLRLTPKRYDALVRYARNANLNMLRSEGFSIRELEDFYDACDRNGVMVTQQIFGRSIPDEPLAIACIEDMMLRIRNHPSLVHFLGHDETFPTDTLDAAYKGLIAKYTPSRTYQPHSGAFDIEERFKTGGTRTGSREVWTYAGPAHYYVSHDTGAWGFAQSGGIGGIVASMDSIRRMMPDSELWPIGCETWSLHTVIQGSKYFDAVVKAMDRRYGAAANFEDFCRKAYAMNYESARGMFEAYGRNKYSATGITTWKYDAAWPAAMTWQYVDWYLSPTAAYYAAQKACEPLHVQYSYDDNSVWVVNTYGEPQRGLAVTATLYDFALKERLAKNAKVSVDPDGKTEAFKVEIPQDISATYFVKLTLADASGKPVTDNTYWLSTVPDIPGKETEFGDIAYSLEPKSTADMSALSSLPPATVTSSFAIEDAGKERIVRVTLRNTGDALAFMVRADITQGENGHQLCPVFWNENYVTLFPGETKILTAHVYAGDIDGVAPAISLTGWNVK